MTNSTVRNFSRASDIIAQVVGTSPLMCHNSLSEYSDLENISYVTWVGLKLSTSGYGYHRNIRTTIKHASCITVEYYTNTVSVWYNDGKSYYKVNYITGDVVSGTVPNKKLLGIINNICSTINQHN